MNDVLVFLDNMPSTTLRRPHSYAGADIFHPFFFVRGRGLFSPEVFAPGLFHALCVSAHGLLFIGVSAHVFVNSWFGSLLFFPLRVVFVHCVLL